MTALERSLASLEQALALEIQRRIDLESRIASQVEAGLRQAVRSATGVVEEQLATVQRQQADEIRLRLLALERTVASVQHRLSHVEGLGKSTEKPGGERQLAWLESRVAGLELKKPLDMPLEVSRQLQLIRSELMDEAAARWQDVAQLIRAEIDDARQRVDALERWLREAVAPEVVRLQLDLASERRCREQLEKKVVQTTQRSPRVPPVNKATWSFESILPRDGSQKQKAPEPKPLEMAQNQGRELEGDHSATQRNQLTRLSESTKLLEEQQHIEANTAASAASASLEAFAPEKDMKDTVEGTLTADGDGLLGDDSTKEKKDVEHKDAEKSEEIDRTAPGVHSGELEEGKKAETVQASEHVSSSSEASRGTPQRALLGRMRRSLKDR